MASPNDFVGSIWPYALQASKTTGIDPRIIAAQSVQETGWGKSAPNNNYFGIKGHGSQQPTFEYDSNGQRRNTVSNFAAYPSAGDAFTGANGYSETMQKSFPSVGAAQGFDAQLDALGRSRYATDPNYARSVGSIARRLPVPVAGAAAAGAGAPTVANAATQGAGANPPADHSLTSFAHGNYVPGSSAAGMDRPFVPSFAPQDVKDTGNWWSHNYGPIQNQGRFDMNSIHPMAGVDVAHLTPPTQTALMKTQQAYGQPLSIESGYRSPVHNRAVGGAIGGEHPNGDAVDIHTPNYSEPQKQALVADAVNSGFRGFGLYGQGAEGNNLHFDLGVHNGARAWGGFDARTQGSAAAPTTPAWQAALHGHAPDIQTASASPPLAPSAAGYSPPPSSAGSVSPLPTGPRQVASAGAGETPPPGYGGQAAQNPFGQLAKNVAQPPQDDGQQQAMNTFMQTINAQRARVTSEQV